MRNNTYRRFVERAGRILGFENFKLWLEGLETITLDNSPDAFKSMVEEFVMDTGGHMKLYWFKKQATNKNAIQELYSKVNAEARRELHLKILGHLEGQLSRLRQDKESIRQTRASLGMTKRGLFNMGISSRRLRVSLSVAYDSLGEALLHIEEEIEKVENRLSLERGRAKGHIRQ